MMGLVFLFALLLYLAISVVVVWFFARMAKQRGITPWKWGVPAGLVMYLLVFWDHIPTLVAHKYYCDKYAGLTVYKTPEQWKQENPGVAETLTYKNALPTMTTLDDGIKIQRLNERFIRESSDMSVLLLPIRLEEDIIKDEKTGDVVVRKTGVNSGYGSIALGSSTGDWRIYKFWVGAERCMPKGFREVFDGFREIGRKLQ